MDEQMRIGEIIKDLRKKQHLSQAKLAEGICSKDYIYAVENNKYVPSWYILDLISKKLNFDLYDYYKAILSHTSWETHVRIMKLNEYISEKNVTELKKEISICETQRDFEEGEPLQVLLYAKAYYTYHHASDLSLSIDLCLAALKVLKPHFTLETINFENYSNTEYAILNQLAFCYIEAGISATAISIYTNLYNKLSYLTKCDLYLINLKLHFDVNLFLVTCLNLSILKLQVEEYDEATKVLEKGIVMSNRTHNMTWLADLLLCQCNLLCIQKQYSAAISCLHDAKVFCKYSSQPNKADIFRNNITAAYPELLNLL